MRLGFFCLLPKNFSDWQRNCLTLQLISRPTLVTSQSWLIFKITQNKYSSERLIRTSTKVDWEYFSSTEKNMDEDFKEPTSLRGSHLTRCHWFRSAGSSVSYLYLMPVAIQVWLQNTLGISYFSENKHFPNNKYMKIIVCHVKSFLSKWTALPCWFLYRKKKGNTKNQKNTSQLRSHPNAFCELFWEEIIS